MLSQLKQPHQENTSKVIYTKTTFATVFLSLTTVMQNYDKGEGNNL